MADGSVPGTATTRGRAGVTISITIACPGCGSDLVFEHKRRGGGLTTTCVRCRGSFDLWGGKVTPQAGPLLPVRRRAR